MKKQILAITLIASLFTNLQGHNTAKLLGGGGALLGGAAAMAYCNGKIKKIEDTLLKQDPKSWNFVQEEALLREKNKLQLFKKLALISTIIGGIIFSSELFQNNLAGGLAFLPFIGGTTSSTPYLNDIPPEESFGPDESCNTCFGSDGEKIEEEDLYEPKVSLIRIHCGHITCRNCLITALNRAIRGQGGGITCQEYGCNEALTIEDIMKVFPQDPTGIVGVLEAQALALVQTGEILQEDERVVRCPYPNCPNFWIIEAGMEQTNQFRECPGPHIPELEDSSDLPGEERVRRAEERIKKMHYVCLQCETIHNPGTDCPEREDPDAWLTDNIYHSKCPRCRNLIEKGEACLHMSCPRPCGHEYCWGCKQPFYAEPGHHIIHGYFECPVKRIKMSGQQVTRYRDCPQCRRRINLNRNTLHIRCAGGHEFCWGCGLAWDNALAIEGHTEHECPETNIRIREDVEIESNGRRFLTSIQERINPEIEMTDNAF